MFRTLIGTSIALALLGTCLPALATEEAMDGSAPAQSVNYVHWPGADQEIDSASSVSGGSTHLFLAGSAFTPRTSSQTVTYPGGGCLYSSGAVTTSLELPNNTLIHGVRVFYYSPISTARIGVFLTTYPGNGTLTDLLTGTTTFSGGYSDDYFSTSSALVVDNGSGSYVLTATMDPGTRFCGMRVFYSV